MFSSNTSQVSSDAVFVEDIFQSWLYTGNGSTQTITNGIDLAGKGGLTWIKKRDDANSHMLFDTVRGANKYLISNSTAAQGTTLTNTLTAFNSDGFSLGADTITGNVNASGSTYASWTFRKQPKFFDVVTYTGNGVAGRQIPHSLKSVPGCIIVKSTTRVDGWAVYHRSIGATKFLTLNTTGDAVTDSLFWSNSEPTDTAFTVGTEQMVNAVGQTYVAYLFAHNAGGFGLTGTDNVISCGSFVDNSPGSIINVNLGYEAQLVLVKNAGPNIGAYGEWRLYDNMRGMSETGAKVLYPDKSYAEDTDNPILTATSTGFKVSWPGGGSGNTYIYIAIRRGPMRTPTSGTSVFAVNASTGTGSSRQITTNFPVDLGWSANRASVATVVLDRLRGTGVDTSKALLTFDTGAEYTISAGYGQSYDSNTGVVLSALGQNGAGVNYVYYNFRRAPGFFDEVCYTGTGDGTFVARPHNLTVKPELIIIKSRSAAASWPVLFNMGASSFNRSFLNTTGAAASINYSNTDYLSSEPTSTNVLMGAYDDASWNASGATYVMYLFASCPGVSKVGSYTGTGTTQQINCGFTGGARFVLIKRTDSTGDWYVWDSARGIVSGNDPYLLLNSTAAEVTNTDYVDTYSAGFEISSTAPAAINASGGSFIFLAIA